MSFKKFTFVRNPYKRACSGIRYLSEQYSDRDSEFPTNLNDFYNLCLQNTFFYVHFNMTQCTALRDLNNEIHMDFIGKFENYNEDLEYMIFNLMEFPRIDISKFHIHKSDPKMTIFDEEIVNEIVNIIHDEDFNEFDYNKKFNKRKTLFFLL